MSLDGRWLVADQGQRQRRQRPVRVGREPSRAARHASITEHAGEVSHGVAAFARTRASSTTRPTRAASSSGVGQRLETGARRLVYAAPWDVQSVIVHARRPLPRADDQRRRAHAGRRRGLQAGARSRCPTCTTSTSRTSTSRATASAWRAYVERHLAREPVRGRSRRARARGSSRTRSIRRSTRTSWSRPR